MRFLFALLLALGLAGCLADSDTPVRTVGGSAVEGETVTARILGRGGRTLGDLAVRVYDDATDISLGSVRTDGSGICAIPVPAGIRRIRLELEDPAFPGETIVFVLVLRPGLDTTLVAERWSRLDGRLEELAGWTPVQVLQRESGTTAAVAADSFSIPFLPPGTWDFVLVADSAGRRRSFDLGKVAVPSGGSTVRAVLHRRALPNLAVEFEDSVSWLAAVCIAEDRPGPDRSCLDTAAGNAAWQGASLRATLSGSASTRQSVRILVDRLEPVDPSINPGDTLSMVLRGTGTLQVRLGMHSAGLVDSGRVAFVTATSGWTRIDIPVDGLLPDGSPSGPLAWISFETNSQAWIVLDHIQLLGSLR